MQERVTYSAAAIRERERARKRAQRRRLIGGLVAAALIGGNIALFVYRDAVISWVRSTFGTLEVTVDRAGSE